MNSYRGLHADHYDRIFEGKPYATEARWVAGLLPAPPGGLLDVACGTGRHAAEFADLGYDVVGVDLNPALLERARPAVPRARFVEGDMCALARTGLQPGSFTAVTCLFDSIGYPGDNDAIVAALRGMGELLAEGGRMAVEFLHTPAMLRHASPLGVRRWELPGGGHLLRVAETTLDERRGTMDVAYELVELRGDGGWRRHAERQGNRFFAVEEMRALLALAGLRADRFLPAYGSGEVTAETFHVVVVTA
jgi:SAM-dependent methyltransferase